MDEPYAESSAFEPVRPPTRRERNRPSTANLTQDGAPAICRICRGEGTSSEPLFHPCKCSGSIKFVHQECLMEWLSHSQKKYCELCKTSFRFTKLYAPDMPQSLPVHVFLEHMAKWLFRNTLVWMRALLTVSIWMCWLPYFMRSVWSFMFWISDQGLGATAFLSYPYRPPSISVEMPSGECPSNPLQPRTMTMLHEVDSLLRSLSLSRVPEAFVKLMTSASGVLVEVNSTEIANSWRSHANVSVDGTSVVSTSSLLSDVALFSSLTRSQTMNRAIVRVVEGQIITVLVIVCFILVILVRDYVIQQQPEINMRAAFAQPEELQEHHHQQPDAALNIQGVQENLPVAETNAHDNIEPRRANGDVQHRNLPVDIPPLDHTNSAQRRTRSGKLVRVRPEVTDEDGEIGEFPQWVKDFEELLDSDQRNGTHSNMSAYIGILRHSDLETTMRFLNQENFPRGDNLRVVLEQFKEEHIARQIKFREMKMAADGASSSAASMGNNAEGSIEDRGRIINGSPSQISSEEPTDENVLIEERGSVGQGSDEAWRPHSPGNAALPDFSLEGPSDEFVRPRAASDGPSAHNTAHPLGSNSWSFAGLPSEDIESTLAPPANLDRDETGTNDSQTTPISGRYTEFDDDAVFGIPSTANTINPRQQHELEQPAFDNHQLTNEPTGNDVIFSEEEPTTPLASGMVPQQVDGILANEDAVHPEEASASVNAEAALQENGNPIGLLGRFTDFMWGDLDNRIGALPLAPEQLNELEAALDEPFVDVPIANGVAPNADADVDVNADADADAGVDADAEPGPGEIGDEVPPAGIDQEAIEEMEDFEGVMELVGMRGPIAGLFQNAIFCSVLVSVSIFACVFVPYNIGRITVWLSANPMRLVRLIVEVAKLIQDATILVVGLASWCALNFVDMVTRWASGSFAAHVVTARKASWNLWTAAGFRVFDPASIDVPITANEVQNFSAFSHEALLLLKARMGWLLGELYHIALALVRGRYLLVDKSALAAFGTGVRDAALAATSAFSLLLTPSTWVIDLGEATRAPAPDPQLADWSGMDRFWAILIGYFTLFTVGALYLRRDSPFSTSSLVRAWEAGVIDTLQQASGIMKVILIISIEMLVFPLYCGLLLDIALLPLFENATIASRMMFSYDYPLTSAFVHWFVGTGYMFHFALFVSMCRKIMRQGVLHFIRDPDDPEFHPVRDVLERNLTTQLRKILFSAFVYGALVIVCLGGVVWGLSASVPTVLPVHYSSNEPILEFPVDLLFYNFLMPLAVKFFKPSDGIHAMYTWWFRKCARGLRLTFFLFGERKIDEEGRLQLPPDSVHEETLYNRFFLELDERNRVIPKTWKDTFESGKAKPNEPPTKAQRKVLKLRKSYLVSSKQLIKDGRFVRAPASDRVKIPKGKQVFLPVTESNRRRDGEDDSDLYGSDLYQFVYIPPNFRTRIFSFILFIWLFAAVTGVGLTIVPLVIGRMIFKMMIPDHIRTNDIYAFSIGIYLLGSVLYGALNSHNLLMKAQRWARQLKDGVLSRNGPKRAATLAIHASRLFYTYFTLYIVFPLLASALMELYVTIPLHTYMHPPGASNMAGVNQATEAGKHTVRVVQAWTLGLLYLKLGLKMIRSLFPETRAAVAVQMVLQRGWLYPNVSVFTRAFVVPGFFLCAIAMTFPPMVVSFLVKKSLLGLGHDYSDPEDTAARMVMMYRYSYPIAAFCAVMVRNTLSLVQVFNGWTAGIRDEAYLIGERLHNFGAATAGARKAATAWRARGTRL